MFADDGDHVAAILATVEGVPEGTPELEVVRQAGLAFASVLEERRRAAAHLAAGPSLTSRPCRHARCRSSGGGRSSSPSGSWRATAWTPGARLVAKVGVACAQAALEEWSIDPSGPLAPHVDAAFAQLLDLR